jgi:hypothetical protein
MIGHQPMAGITAYQMFHAAGARSSTHRTIFPIPQRGVPTSFGPDLNTFLWDGAFHKKYKEQEREHDNRQHPKHIEIGE